jgi:hypothetical protein
MLDALDKRDGAGVLSQTLVFFPLIAAVVGVAALTTLAKMTLQHRWRAWLNARVLDQWLANGRYYQLNMVPGDHANPEYRVAEDLRQSVEAPVDFSPTARAWSGMNRYSELSDVPHVFSRSYRCAGERERAEGYAVPGSGVPIQNGLVLPISSR